MEVSWPDAAGLGTLICDGDSACDSVNFPIPPSDIPLNIICDSEWECIGADIYCPENAGCIINCTARQSCRVVCRFTFPTTPHSPMKIIKHQYTGKHILSRESNLRIALFE